MKAEHTLSAEGKDRSFAIYPTPSIVDPQLGLGRGSHIRLQRFNMQPAQVITTRGAHAALSRQLSCIDRTGGRKINALAYGS